MEKIKIEKILTKNFYIKKIKNLTVMAKEQLPVLVQDRNGKWKPSGALAPIYNGQRIYEFRVVGGRLEFHFIGDPIKFQHSCLCDRAYKYENKIVLPQGCGDGYVVITL